MDRQERKKIEIVESKIRQSTEDIICEMDISRVVLIGIACGLANAVSNLDRDAWKHILDNVSDDNPFNLKMLDECMYRISSIQEEINDKIDDLTGFDTAEKIKNIKRRMNRYG